MLFARRNRAVESKLAALDRAQGVIEFDLSGTIVAANANFLAVVGYELSEIVGQHHRMFVDPVERESAGYATFWERLRSGGVEAARFRRIGKGGREVWIEASYNPLLGGDGKPYGVVKFATDITAQKTEDTDRAGQIAAIDKAQAVVSFDLDGRILQANANFLAVVGYGLHEIVGQHHRMFVDPAERESAAYREFWAALKRGTYQAAQYRRIGKGGREVWIQASYNPILDAFGKPYKVMKFATDITDQVRMLNDLRRLIDQNFAEIDGAVGHSTEASGAARTAAGATKASVQSMAAAAEELAASVGEMSRSMARSQEATEQAFTQVQDADGHTKRLADATGAMTGIVGMIQTIAAQINLLALNATIEAARAGEAGRGFAVVAQEVKVLADQAARATDQINEEINRVQGVSHEVVAALGAIRDSVGVMRGHIVATGEAIDQQDAVTRDLSRNMGEVASAVGEIVGDIDRIGGAVSQVSTAVSTTREAARVLAR